MAKLSERERIDILNMIGLGDKLQTRQGACQLQRTLTDHQLRNLRLVGYWQCLRELAMFEGTGNVEDAPPRVEDKLD